MVENLYLSKDLGFLRVAAAVPKLRVAGVEFNVGNIIENIKWTQRLETEPFAVDAIRLCQS